jgi:hypothetical protein
VGRNGVRRHRGIGRHFALEWGKEEVFY